MSTSQALGQAAPRPVLRAADEPRSERVTLDIAADAHELGRGLD
jgi:hypothetical protein